MKGVFAGYLFNGFSRLAGQMPYWIGPFAIGQCRVPPHPSPPDSASFPKHADDVWRSIWRVHIREQHVSPQSSLRCEDHADGRVGSRYAYNNSKEGHHQIQMATAEGGHH